MGMFVEEAPRPSVEYIREEILLDRGVSVVPQVLVNDSVRRDVHLAKGPASVLVSCEPLPIGIASDRGKGRKNKQSKVRGNSAVGSPGARH